MTRAADTEAAFAALIARHEGEAGVTTGRMFGSDVLKLDTKTFAILTKGKLVVKLPEERAAALRADGTAKPFDPGHGRPMKEWIEVGPAHIATWQRLAEESKAFVRTLPVKPARKKKKGR